MPSITYTIDKMGFNVIEKTALRTQDLRVPFKRIGGLMVRSITRNFKEGGRPVKWDPSHRARGMIKGKPKGITLTEHGGLKNSIKHEAHRQFVTIGTNKKYGPAHQFGFSGTVHQSVKEHWRKVTQAFGRKLDEPMMVNVEAFERTLKLKIPKRPFLIVQDEDMTRSVGILKRFIVEGKA